MAIIAWPDIAEFAPIRFSWGVTSARTSWVSPYTGQRQSVSHLVSRLRVVIDLPLGDQVEAGLRESYLMAASSNGDWIRLWHMQRPTPTGTLRGSPVVATTALAGATTLSLNTTSNATLRGGDVLGFSDQLVQCGYQGAVANSGGSMTMPTALPLRRTILAGTVMIWDKPTGAFQLDSLDPTFDYMGPSLQQGMTISLSEVFA